MSEELLQKDLIKNPAKIGKWDFYNIGATSVKNLKEYGIIRNVNYGKEEKKKVDGLIVQSKNVIAVIEYKKPSEFKTKAQKNKAIKQELQVAKKLGAHIIIGTDTLESIWVNVLTGKRIKDENGKELTVNFDPLDSKIPALIEKVKFSINELNDQIKPKELVNPTDLAKSIWQDIWSVSGESPTNCLYTFVELFIFKYLSDLKILGQGFNFKSLMERFNYDTENPNEEALDYYARNIRPKIKKLFPNNPIDNTTIINGTVFVNKDDEPVIGYSTAFKKVLDKFRKYNKGKSLENIDYDFKSQLFEVFLKEGISKKNLGQYFTPLKVVHAISEMAKDEIKVGAKICDPACGVGKFLLEPIATKLNQFFKVEKGEIISNITIHGFDKGFDKDEQKTIILAKANMLIYFSDLIKENPSLTSEFSNVFNQSFNLKTNSILGTLSDPVENEYDLIFTNPPYVTSGSSNLKDEIKNNGVLSNYYKINGMGVEGLFMEWIVRALKPNGKAFIIVPDGIFNRQNDKNLRQFIIDECYIDGIISLPLNTFFTTNKKTYILCLTKKVNSKDTQKDPVFTYLTSEIGESRDIYRFDIEEDDLSEAVTLYSFFKGNKKSFSKINSDKRCKIFPIELFDPEKHWSIDRWWTQEEKIEIGIIEENKSISTTEFGDFVGEVADSLLEFKELLQEVNQLKKKDKKLIKKIFLSDKKLFELFIGKRLLKRDLVKIEGEIPIFSANVFKPISFHNKSNISDFNNDFVLWGIDGDFEFNFIKKGEKFVTTDHCGAIRIKDSNILPEYLISQLYSVKHKYGFDRALRASLKNMKSIEIEIPIDENGEWDVNTQQSVVDKFTLIKELRKDILVHEEKLAKINVTLDSDSTLKEFPLTKLFSIERGKGKYTKSYGNSNKGENPVYSASNNAPLTYLNTFDYDGEFLTWATNGFAGYIKIINGKFSINADRGLLKPLSKNIDIQYVKHILEPVLRDLAKGRKGEKGEDEFTKVYPTMLEKIKVKMPLDKNGKIDLKQQKKIASEYRKIEDIKLAIKNELDKITSIEIDYE
ncbi:N-6 DNA methylase [Spongiivirga citrea]|uniref:site-specific DNA-methyltransferase (adenine-specific) n=1 Tax=Spongiivirga citrea TaxID=1481457 RepID=A0A6M0CJ05_9FLAO|nr:N-6 DNA methylase [Spongiivirga citrea]NER17532.1 N-6 DNA methylase [Spongiivirga citrea]